MLQIFYNKLNSIIYANIYNSNKEIYNVLTQSFEIYNSNNIYNYCVGEENSIIDTETINIFSNDGDNLYYANFPNNIEAGIYNIVLYESINTLSNKIQISEGQIVWNGDNEILPFDENINIYTLQESLNNINDILIALNEDPSGNFITFNEIYLLLTEIQTKLNAMGNNRPQLV